ncbi:hypothetical protein DSM25559_1873 [Agrobacterium rosae]|uniref:Uncharacterized protein n=1 Tax=Agrobacterium rosae TaxID=1972867 RepID=A0A1R3TLR7_9HYPH|nr:hypothetical protein DSM25559_1873 [Agrobacterium rosae]
MTSIVPVINIESKENLRSTINQVIRQVSDTTGSIQITGSGSINITNTKIYSDTKIILIPRNLAASTATYYISNISDGSATIVINGSGAFDFALVGVR